MLETDALKEKLEMEIHRFARPPEELSSGDPYFEQLQTMLAIREELVNIPLCDIQRNIFQFISDCEHGLKLLNIRIAGRKSLRRSCKAMDFHFQLFF